MPGPTFLDPTRSALLIMDFQPPIVQMIADSEPLLQKTADVLAACRQRGLLIITIAVGFRPGYPEISARNAAFQQVKESGRLPAQWPEVELHPVVALQPGDIAIIKHRVGAFSGTDLEMVLRAHNIETLILCGIATSGVVLSTVRHAADADYRLIVLHDCCADGDPEVHRCLVEKVFPRQATVLTAEEFQRQLGAGE